VVVGADGGLHDVRHRGAAIHDDPFAVVFPLDAGFGKAGLAHGVAHARGQRLGLPVGGARGNDHPLEQRRQMLGIENLDVLPFHILQAIDDGTLELLGVFFGGRFSGHQVGR
jgi:hypothetical protein